VNAGRPPLTRAPPRTIAALTLVAAVAAAAPLPLAQPPYVGPIHLAAGLAAAAALAWGRHAAAAAVIGLLLGQFFGRSALGQPLAASVALAAAAAIAPALSAALARVAFAASDLDRPAGFLRFLLSGAALPSAAGAAAALAAAGFVATDSALEFVAQWWVADTVGIVLGAPIALAFLGEPRAPWAARRLTVAAPLAAIAVLLSVGLAQVARAEAERRLNLFRRDAAATALAVEARFNEHLAALYAAAGAFLASSDVSRAEFRRLTAHWIASQPTLAAIGWSQRLAGWQLAEFERRVRRERPQFRVFDRDDAGTTSAPAPADEYVVLTYIEPEEPNAAALGVNALSISAPRLAIQRALHSGQPTATGAFRLTQDPAGAHLGMVVYLPAESAGGGDDAWRQRGVVFVTLRVSRAFSGRGDSALAACLFDLTPDAPHELLAGDDGCREPEPQQTRYEHAFDFGGRLLSVRVLATPAYRALHAGSAPLGLPLLSLAVGALVAAFLLYAAGSAERVRRVVTRRTEWLRREMAQRRAQQDALRDSEERLRRILDLAPVGLTYTDPDGRFLYANPCFCAMVGRSPAELQARTLADISDPELHAENTELRSRLLAGEFPLLRRTTRYVRPDGTLVPAEVLVTVERDGDGKPRRVLAAVEELSARMRLQEAERARALAEEANRAKTEFLSRMSHELRTPLNAILGFAQLLELDRTQPLAESQRERARRIQVAGWHLLAMIDDVLDLSRVESGAVSLSLEPLDLEIPINDALHLQRAAIAQAGLQLVQRIAPDARYARGDATRVKQVLTNLISNAVKYNRPGGTLAVVAERAGERVRVHVADTGVGMTPEKMQRLFRPFDRLGQETSGIEGTGIGLVIARRLVEMMGGELTVDSRAGEGSRFSFTLPAATAPAAIAQVPAPAHTDAGLAGKLLYIEDNPANAEVVRGLLAARPGLQLTVCERGLQGLEAARREPPDAILLDLRLPDADGLHLLAEFKRDERLAAVPVIVISADAMADRIDAALRAGAAAFLSKPLRAAELLGLIERTLRR
jgi:PAS domain S-box-containing protein